MNPTIKAIIIDDEERARVNLKFLLEEFCPEIQVVAECKKPVRRRKKYPERKSGTGVSRHRNARTQWFGAFGFFQ